MEYVLLFTAACVYFIFLLVVQFGSTGWPYLSVDSAVKTLNNSFYGLPFVLAPIAFAMLLTMVFYATGTSLDMVWLVVPIIVVLRFLAIVLGSRLNRVSLAPMLLLSVASCVVAYFAFGQVSEALNVDNFADPFVLLASIIMVLSIYAGLSNARFGDIDQEESYARAVMELYGKYKLQFGRYIPRWFAPHSTQQRIFYAIMITEDLNRPRMARLLERMLFREGSSMSTGIMQVQSPTYLSNERSILIAGKIIKSSYIHHSKHESDDYHLIRLVANDYNSSVYAEIVTEVYYILKKHERDIDGTA